MHDWPRPASCAAPQHIRGRTTENRVVRNPASECRHREHPTAVALSPPQWAGYPMGGGPGGVRAHAAI